MMSRNRNNAAIPDTLTSNQCKNNLSEIIANIISGDIDRIKIGKDKISATYYRGNKVENNNTIQDVVIGLKSIYGDKCVFCESRRYNPNVEHFRPKKGVVGIAKNQHYGYYWLCYEWTNLIPSCPDCNDAKGNHFPIGQEQKRVYGPTYNINGQSLSNNSMIFDRSPLSDEEPMLLHPGYHDNCDSYFAFNSRGEISGTDAAGRGELCRVRYALDRPDLNYERQKEINTFVLFFEMALYFPEDDKFIDVLEKLRYRGVNLDIEYTALCKYVYNNFDNIIVPLLPILARNRAENIYLNNRNPI